MKAGEFVGARPPYGYLKSPDNCHKLIIDEETAPVVRQIFQWAYEQVGLNDITRRLNEAGVPTPSHTKKAAGLISHENLIGKNAWQTRTVSKILSCETYIGDLVQGKTKTVCHQQTYADESNWIKVENTHEAIISREMFDAVQVFRRQAAEEAIQTPKSPYTPNMFKGKSIAGTAEGVCTGSGANGSAARMFTCSTACPTAVLQEAPASRIPSRRKNCCPPS